MKKIMTFLIIALLTPFIVNADGYKVINHYIDSEIEIGGALNVKELIIIEGTTDFLSRKLNYYSFGDKAWDNKTVELDNGTIYNGQGISISRVSAFEVGDKDTFDFNTLDSKVTKTFNELDLDNPQNNTYTFHDNEDGTGNLKIFYPVKGKKVAFFFQYAVTNVVVKHNDVKELNYTFKNLKYNAEATYLRVILPYPTKDDLYHFWMHGNQSGTLKEITYENGNKAGAYVYFPTIKEEVNVRVTLPQEHVGVDLFLHKSNVDALDDIIKIESKKASNTTKGQKVQNITKYTLWILSGLYVVASILMYLFFDKLIYIFYSIFGLLIILVNFLFKFNYWYIYLVILLPIIIGILKRKKLFVK